VGLSVSEERVWKGLQHDGEPRLFGHASIGRGDRDRSGAVTAMVLTVNVALLAPAGTVTLGSTLAAPLLLASITCAPPVSAGPLSVTVPVEDCAPPVTLVGFNVSEDMVGGLAASTVSEAVLVTQRRTRRS